MASASTDADDSAKGAKHRAPTSALPTDHHVHSEWSWDAPLGSMLHSCRRAAEIGLPALAFTEHVDHTVWRVDFASLPPEDHLASIADAEGFVHPPAFDVGGYFIALDECRSRFPELTILSGVELGEPHRHEAQVQSLFTDHRFDRVLGSVHSLRGADGSYAEPPGLFASASAGAVITAYLEEVAALARSTFAFDILAHIDYPWRSLPPDAPPCDVSTFEEPFRDALRSLAESGRALEINTRLPANQQILRWWKEEGGAAISFGSDAHEPSQIARSFATASRIAEDAGFLPGRHPQDLWRR